MLSGKELLQKRFISGISLYQSLICLWQIPHVSPQLSNFWLSDANLLKQERLNKLMRVSFKALAYFVTCGMRWRSDLWQLSCGWGKPVGFLSLASCHIHLRGKTLPHCICGYSCVLGLLNKGQLLPQAALRWEVETPLSSVWIENGHSNLVGIDEFLFFLPLIYI